ncbi:hypothetical protein BH23ACT10_BH23ACT10_10780 [soil metagenome]
MTSEPRTNDNDMTDPVERDVYDELRAETARLRDRLIAVAAAVNVDEPDYLAGIYAATKALYALLALPDDRPGCWEAAHVTALHEPLCEILDALRAERPDSKSHDRGDGDHEHGHDAHAQQHGAQHAGDHDAHAQPQQHGAQHAGDHGGDQS